jgi:hypothetical protein
MKEGLENDYPRSSSFYIYENCPSSYQLAQLSGEEPPNAFSDRGSAIHGWLSGGEQERPPLDPDALLTAKELKGQEEELVDAWACGEEFILMPREERLWMRDGLEPVYSGKPDVWRVSVHSRRALLIDYKTGWHPLDAYVATNCQLRSYVPLLDEELDGQLREVTAAIVKPGRKLKPALFTREEIDLSREWALALARQVSLPISQEEGAQLPLNRGEWCKYCPGKVLCPAWKDEIESLSDLLTARVSDIPDYLLAQIGPRLSIARTVIERLEERLYSRVKEAPHSFPDWRLEKGSVTRSVPPLNVPLVYDLLVASRGDLTPAEFLSACKLSLPSLEKSLRSRKKLSRADLNLLLETEIGSLIERKRSRDSLVYDPHHEKLAPKPQTQIQSLPSGNQSHPTPLPQP